MGQTVVLPGQRQKNFVVAQSMVRRAAENSCDVVVLPECGDEGWTHESAENVTERMFDDTVDAYRAVARENCVAIVAGLTERAGQHVHNMSVAIDAAGHVCGIHRKIHEIEFAKKIYETGHALCTVDFLDTRVGIPICADNLGESIFIADTLCEMGAAVILSPCAWAVPPDFDEDLTPYGREWVEPYTRIARHWHVPVIGVSNVGPVIGGDWDGWSCIGRSLAVDASGAVIARLAYGEPDFAVVEV